MNASMTGSEKLEEFKNKGFELVGYAIRREKEYHMLDKDGRVLWSNDDCQHPLAIISVHPEEKEAPPIPVHKHSPVKRYIAAATIAVLAVTWFGLDQENRKIENEIAKTHEELVSLIAKEKSKNEALRASLLTELNACQVNAKQTMTSFVISKQKPVKGKAGQYTVTQADADAAMDMLATKNADCQQSYYDHLKTVR